MGGEGIIFKMRSLNYLKCLKLVGYNFLYVFFVIKPTNLLLLQQKPSSATLSLTSLPVFGLTGRSVWTVIMVLKNAFKTSVTSLMVCP